MTLEHEKSDKPRSALLIAKRRLCFEHAQDLVEAAERVLSKERPLPNIFFHLVLLAVEEMGKAGLITSREASAGNRDSGWIDKRLDDHAFKLLWGLWSPAFDRSAKFDPERFRQLKEFS
jgi:AbiV family abortive infection protein